VAVAPFEDHGVLLAVEEGGGHGAAPAEADALVWTDAGDPEALRGVLASSSARWVQLPFAGIERFVDSGVIGPDRIWTCAKGIYGAATAEHALALMLAAARQIHNHARRRSWIEVEHGSLERRLAGSTVVIFGAGGIGTSLTSMLGPLEARVIAVNRSGAPVPGAAQTVRTVELASTLPEGDWVVITAPLTSETKGLFGRSMLAEMRPDAWLVNVARGGIVETNELVDVLSEGRIAGAALDVTDPEPLPEGHPLWAMDNVIITPHVANTWDMALPELRGLVRRNVAHFASGEPLEGVVDPATGY
jgi:D-3-phosphoglycerate dehydrogenase